MLALLTGRAWPESHNSSGPAVQGSNLRLAHVTEPHGLQARVAALAVGQKIVNA